MKEFNEWKEDTQKAIDYDTSFKFYFPLTRPAAIMLPESVQLISTHEAAASLQRLPASRRSVVVSMEQLVLPTGLDEKGDYRYKELSHPEIAAEIAKQGVAMRNRMKKEEQEMRIYQHEAISIFLQALERNFPDKYGKHGSNAQAQSALTNRNSSFGPRPDSLSRPSDPRRQPAPILIPKGSNMVSSVTTPKSALFSASSDKDTDMRDAPQQVPAVAQIPVAPPAPALVPLPAQPGISRDPRKPPPPFNPYTLARQEIIHSAPPPITIPARREESLHLSPYGRREEPMPPTGPLNPYARREGHVSEDIYSRRENIQPQRTVAFSNPLYSKQSPMPSSLPSGRPAQSPASPASEHGHRTSIQMPRQGNGSVIVGREGPLGANASRWDVSPMNVDGVDAGEAAWLRRKSMSESLGR